MGYTYGKKNQLIKCACGCGLFRLKYDLRGRERKYLKDHFMIGKTYSKLTTKKLIGKCAYCNKKFLYNFKTKRRKYCSRKCGLKNVWENPKRKKYSEEYYQKNKDKYLERSKTPKAKKVRSEYRKKHRKLARLRTKQWKKTNHKYVIERNNKYKKIKRKTDKEFRIRNILSCRMRSAFRKHFKFGEIILKDEYGIDYKKIIEHLKPFPEDLSKYHIDHIRPICSFNFINEDSSTNLEEVKKAFLPSNHQWLTVKENQKKGGKWDGIQ